MTTCARADAGAWFNYPFLTGYEADAETGLNFAQARYQSSVQGRFTSADPLLASASVGNPQSFNRYTYVVNNPVNLTDPSGLVNNHGDSQYPWEEDHWGDIPWTLAGSQQLQSKGATTVGTAGKAAGETAYVDVADAGLGIPQNPAQQPGTITGTVVDAVVSTNGVLQGEVLPWRISDNGLDFIKTWEQFRSNLYNDQGGHCTIGYGHLVHLGGCNAADRTTYSGGISEVRATSILRTDVRSAENDINNRVNVPLTQNQVDALVSFRFNIGPGGFGRSSALGQLNLGHYDRVPARMARWNTTSGHVSRGLIRRRREEGVIFRSP